MSDKAKNIVVEIPLQDGWMSMFIGEIVSQTNSTITLRKASWIADTGRRYLFFAGTPDSNAKIEPYPDKVTIQLPAAGAVVTSWPYDLPRKAA